MSDALCGPSNALQNFQKHASVDRTLQQDRLISRRSPSQGFRSQNFNDGILDPEFAAFESNLAGTPLPDLQNPAHFLTPSPHFAVHNHAEDHNWATDFQNLQISGPSPLAHQQASMASASAPTLAQHGWQDDFIKQQQQPSPEQQHQAFAQRFQPSFAPRYSMHEATVNSSPSVQNMTTSQLLPTEAFDESAFEAAFEQARADLASQTADHTQEVTHEITQLDNTATSQAQEPIRIGSDTILQPVKDDARVHLNDADELARTAGQLLESVSHDHSRKFRESNFLALMRRIRDREVHIEGDEFRESSQPLHPGGKYYPEGKTHTQQEQSPSMMTKNHNERKSVYGDSIHPLPMVTEDETPNIASHADIVNGLGTGGEDQSLHESWMFGDRWA
ncbi:hypothetical protein BDV23DRAFT_165586 [Aspergillus alliaceus]|uniref:Peroxin 20 n=1 Tax=Petromyces alliaceus TaxID=209559 RepID=A0A5N7BTJ3_PETAA|nr:hypothetical protein BDV23DRAFT_165586 [Aspergillus alliaceus]